MILDSSAIVAIVTREPGYEELLTVLTYTDQVGVGAPTLAEAGIMLADRVGDAAGSLLAAFLQAVEVEVVPFGPREWSIAMEAFHRFGAHSREDGLPGLDFGQCLTYATAVTAGRRVLARGIEFSNTDAGRVSGVW